MDKLVIHGGKPLEGTILINGAKNSALVLLAGALLAPEESVITNVPNLADVGVISEVLTRIGVRVHMDLAAHTVRVDATDLTDTPPPYDLVTKMRASFFILGPILARLGYARIPLPGGCSIGSRPVDLHLKGLRSLGAKITIEHGYVEAQADKLIGGPVYLDYPSVGATETIMMAACLAEGTTVIDNCAQEPEIVDLADMLIKMGAKISGAGTQTITVDGVRRLNGTVHECIPDRIETGTFMVAAAVTRGRLTLNRVRADHMQAVISKLQEAGVGITVEANGDIVVDGTGEFHPIDLRTLPYPGFPTDLQSQLMTFLSLVPGTSMVTETVFENRFMHVDELQRMGANIKTEGNCAVIQGVESLTGAPVKATDLRAGAAMILAGLAARGETVVSNVHHIDRGYEDIVGKLSAVGAKISRMHRAEALV